MSVTVLGQLWTSWAAIGDMYERLDYDNRLSNSTRHPFHPGSWPGFGEVWSFVNVQLYKNKEVVDVLKGNTETILNALRWTDYAIPRTEETVVMVDFIRDVREFQAYLDGKRRTA